MGLETKTGTLVNRYAEVLGSGAKPHEVEAFRELRERQGLSLLDVQFGAGTQDVPVPERLLENVSSAPGQEMRCTLAPNSIGSMQITEMLPV